MVSNRLTVKRGRMSRPAVCDDVQELFGVPTDGDKPDAILLCTRIIGTNLNESREYMVLLWPEDEPDVWSTSNDYWSPHLNARLTWDPFGNLIVVRVLVVNLDKPDFWVDVPTLRPSALPAFQASCPRAPADGRPDLADIRIFAVSKTYKPPANPPD